MNEQHNSHICRRKGHCIVQRLHETDIQRSSDNVDDGVRALLGTLHGTVEGISKMFGCCQHRRIVRLEGCH